MKNKNKFLRNRFRLSGILLMIFFILSLVSVSAFCRVGGEIVTKSGDSIGATVTGHCQNKTPIDFQYAEAIKKSGTVYLFSWGDLFSTCDDVCENIYINASNPELGVYGYGEKYPLNAGNSEISWGDSSDSTNIVNIIMDKNYPDTVPVFINLIPQYGGGGSDSRYKGNITGFDARLHNLVNQKVDFNLTVDIYQEGRLKDSINDFISTEGWNNLDLLNFFERTINSPGNYTLDLTINSDNESKKEEFNFNINEGLRKTYSKDVWWIILIILFLFLIIMLIVSRKRGKEKINQ